eukprot:scaffold133282_cov68-Phaeocystis_antarctica.AAC.3
MAFARLAEYAVATAKVAVAADSAEGPLLAWCTKCVNGKVGAAKARFLSEARAQGAIGRRRPIVLSPVARGDWQVMRPCVGSCAVHALSAVEAVQRARSVVRSCIAATIVLPGGTSAVSCGTSGATVVARPTDHALAAALVRLVRAGHAFVARGHARVWRDRAGAARRLSGATGWRVVALGSRRALTTVGKAGGVGVRARQAREGDGGALWTVMALWAGCRRHRCLCTAREACWAKPCTYRARLLAGERSIAAEHAGRAGKGVVLVVRPEWQDVNCLAEQGWAVLPVAGLVEGGGLAGTGRDVAVVDVVDKVDLAACGGRSASAVALARTLPTRLSPDLALGRGHPVARWRGQHVGGGAADAEVEIRASCASFVGHELGSCHRECASTPDTSTLPISAARVTLSRNGCRR